MKKSIVCILGVFLNICYFISCKNDNEVSGKIEKIVWEFEKLSSENELNSFAIRGDTNIVDWQLSMEFAQLYLDDGIEDESYPCDSKLWDIPIPVYDEFGNVKFYEFRIISANKVIGAITGTATKDNYCPITHTFLTDGFSDELSELYLNGTLSEDSVPRVIDNGYPNVIIGLESITKGDSVEFEKFIDINNGNVVLEDEIVDSLTYYEVLENYSDLIECDEEKINALIDSYSEDGTEFWKIAETYRGNIGNFAVRGSSKKKKESISSTKLNKYFKGRTQIVNYGACGPVAAGFILDFLEANDETVGEWKMLSISEKKSELYKTMEVFSCGDGEATWPSNLGNTISKYSNYKTSTSSEVYPKKSIHNDIPGISLRVFGSGFAHYRPVIAYEEKGWWIFTWPRFKILDLVDSDDKRNGTWETYIPVYHFTCYNVVKK